MKYRDHRGSLKDSMKTVQEFVNREDLCTYLYERARIIGAIIEIKSYTYDKRINWDTHLVTINGNAVGYTDGKC